MSETKITKRTVVTCSHCLQ